MSLCIKKARSGLNLNMAPDVAYDLAPIHAALLEVSAYESYCFCFDRTPYTSHADMRIPSLICPDQRHGRHCARAASLLNLSY